MTIRLGRRRRLVLTMNLTLTPPRLWEESVAVGLDDRHLALLAHHVAHDLDHARWEALGLVYGRNRQQ